MAESVPLDRFLTWRLHALSRIADRDSAAAYLAQCGVSLSDGRCLAAIGAFAPLSLRDLARLANQDKSQASRSVASLVGQGLVVKDTSTADGRGIVLGLTPRGKAVHRKAMRLIAARNDEIFAVLDAGERKTLGALVDRVIASMAADATGPEGSPP